jgi:alkanesulfonate monooxygenase SsuD/methylene tetrahydromethanopterin reductase-like flavin-dependent oxidoreductase (luciferase family)
MRIGAFVDQHDDIDSVVGRFAGARAAGLGTLWCSQTFDYDTLALLGIVGRSVPEVELGTAIVPVFTQHPIVLARQALTAQAATGGRLVLGIGPSHRPPMERVFGVPFDGAAERMREYLTVLMAVLGGRESEFTGSTVAASTTLIHVYRGAHLGARYIDALPVAPLDVPDTGAPPVLLAALGPRLLRLAGSMTDGTIAWMTGPALVDDYIRPAVQGAAAEAGRPTPRLVIGNRACLTADPDGVRERLARSAAASGDLPSYRAVLDRQGARTVADVALVGDERSIAQELRRLEAVGATDVLLMPFGTPEEQERTLALAASLG